MNPAAVGREPHVDAARLQRLRQPWSHAARRGPVEGVENLRALVKVGASVDQHRQAERRLQEMAVPG
eukprot:4935465-Pyramimonas_sp.AAC.1